MTIKCNKTKRIYQVLNVKLRHDIRHSAKQILIAFALMFMTAAMLPAQAKPAGLPGAFEADYAVARGGLNLGNLRATLKYAGNKYLYKKFTKATGMAGLLTGIKITENTNGILAGNTVVPKYYLFNQSRRSKSRIDKATFKNNRAVGSYKDTPYDIAIPAGTQDRASMELMLARDMAQNKPRYQYHVVERGKLKTYNFQKLGAEQIKTPAGSYNTVKVKVVRSGKKRETVFWLAKEIDYLPVKITHTEKGEVITTVIKRYKTL